jgi:hypothetical protein
VADISTTELDARIANLIRNHISAIMATTVRPDAFYELNAELAKANARILQLEAALANLSANFVRYKSEDRLALTRAAVAQVYQVEQASVEQSRARDAQLVAALRENANLKKGNAP